MAPPGMPKMSVGARTLEGLDQALRTSHGCPSDPALLCHGRTFACVGQQKTPRPGGQRGEDACAVEVEDLSSRVACVQGCQCACVYRRRRGAPTSTYSASRPIIWYGDPTMWRGDDRSLPVAPGRRCRCTSGCRRRRRPPSRRCSRDVADEGPARVDEQPRSRRLAPGRRAPRRRSASAAGLRARSSWNHIVRLLPPQGRAPRRVVGSSVVVAEERPRQNGWTLDGGASRRELDLGQRVGSPPRRPARGRPH